jgi:hypothetical protein
VKIVSLRRSYSFHIHVADLSLTAPGASGIIAGIGAGGDTGRAILPVILVETRAPAVRCRRAEET